jgi:hypothetical protein
MLTLKWFGIFACAVCLDRRRSENFTFLEGVVVALLKIVSDLEKS